jgi:type II secretory pathway pseudopilin PulG
MKKAFTLVEMAITVIILALIITGTFTLLFKPMSEFYLKTQTENFEEYFAFIQNKNLAEANPNINSHMTLKIDNSSSDYYQAKLISTIGSTTTDIDVLDIQYFAGFSQLIKPAPSSSMTFNLCSGLSNNSKINFCDSSNNIICDEDYYFAIKSKMFDIFYVVLIKTPSQKACTPEVYINKIDDFSTCSESVSYVCGTDGLTYKNECYAGLNNLEVDYEGECE